MICQLQNYVFIKTPPQINLLFLLSIPQVYVKQDANYKITLLKTLFFYIFEIQKKKREQFNVSQNL